MPCELLFCRQLSSLLNRVSQTQTPNTLSQVPQPPVLSTLAAHTHTQMVARLARHTQTHRSPKTDSSSIHVLYRPSGRLCTLQEPRKSPACLTPCTKGGKGMRDGMGWEEEGGPENATAHPPICLARPRELGQVFWNCLTLGPLWSLVMPAPFAPDHSSFPCSETQKTVACQISACWPPLPRVPASSCIPVASPPVACAPSNTTLGRLHAHTHTYTSWGRELHTPGTDGRTARLLGRQSPGIRKSFPARCPTHSQLLTYPHRTRALTHSLTHSFTEGERERKRAHTLSIRRQLDTLPRHPPSFSRTKKPPPSPPLPSPSPSKPQNLAASNVPLTHVSFRSLEGRGGKNGGTHPTTARMRARPLRGDVGGGGTYVGDMPGAYGQVWEQTHEVVVLPCPSCPSLLGALLSCRLPETQPAMGHR